MQWTDLPTNYQDAAWEGNRKFRMTTNNDGTVSFTDVTEYTQVGNSYRSASDVNATNRAINMLVHTFEARYRLDIPTNISINKSGSNAVIKWTDPPNIKDNNNNIIVQWAGTKVVRKTGSAPTSETDGTLVVNETVKDQYKTSGYSDTGLTDGTTYYYGIFPYSTDGNYTIQTVVQYTHS